MAVRSIPSVPAAGRGRRLLDRLLGRWPAGPTAPVAAGVLVVALGLALLAGPAAAQVSEEQALVDRAQLTFQSMARDPNLQAMPTYVRAAEAVLIVPELIRGGFFVGGAGGVGVILERLPDGGWSPPAFYTLAGGSLGLQIGGQVSEVVLAIMTEEGLRALQSRRVTLGADVSIAAANLGIGRGAATGLELNADMYAFSRNQGLYVGGALEGTVVNPSPQWNTDYYGPGVVPQDILAGQVGNPGADGLRRFGFHRGRHLLHGGAPLGRSLFGVDLLALQPPAFDGVLLEHRQRLGHVADLVAAAGARHLDGQAVGRQPAHHAGHACQGLGNVAVHPPGDQHRQNQHQAADDQGQIAPVGQRGVDLPAVAGDHADADHLAAEIAHRQQQGGMVGAAAEEPGQHGLPGHGRAQRLAGEVDIRREGGGELFEPAAIAGQVERHVGAGVRPENLEKVLAEGQAELHRADRVAPMQHRHDAAHPQPGDAAFQAVARHLGFVHLDDGAAESGQVVAMPVRHMDPQERGGRGGVELELADAVLLAHPLEAGDEQLGQGLAVAIGHRLLDRRDFGDEFGHGHGAPRFRVQFGGQRVAQVIQLLAQHPVAHLSGDQKTADTGRRDGDGQRAAERQGDPRTDLEAFEQHAPIPLQPSRAPGASCTRALPRNPLNNHEVFSKSVTNR
jgi:lipid-binding SYLF domain-containing protein